MVNRLVGRLPDRFLWSALHHMDASAAGGPPALFLLRSVVQRPRAEPAARAAVSRLVSSVGGDVLRRLPELVALLTGAEDLADDQRLLIWTVTAETLLQHVEKVGGDGRGA